MYASINTEQTTENFMNLMIKVSIAFMQVQLDLVGQSEHIIKTSFDTNLVKRNFLNQDSFRVTKTTPTN